MDQDNQNLFDRYHKSSDSFDMGEFLSKKSNSTQNGQAGESQNAKMSGGDDTEKISDDTDNEVFMVFFLIAGLSFILILATILACI